LRRQLFVISITLARSAAATSSAASSRFVVKGFSQETCLPAAISVLLCSKCVSCGVAMTAASMASRTYPRMMPSFEYQTASTSTQVLLGSGQ
jgi:hypothetical protein